MSQVVFFGILILVVALVLASIATLLLRRKHRFIWHQLFQLHRKYEALSTEIIDVRKQIILERERGQTRLPALLPSQNGEDLLLWNFFGRKRKGFYVDVGAYDGIDLSNTYFFEAIGWNGLLIEAGPEFYENCLSSRPNSIVINAVACDGNSGGSVAFTIAEGDGGVGTLSYHGDNPKQLERITREGGAVRTTVVPTISLDAALYDHQGTIDFVSIDVEGSELKVLHGLDLEKFSPRVLVIEDNTSGRDRRVKDYLLVRGYEERFRCEQNVFYTRNTDEGVFSWTEVGKNNAE